MKDYKLLINPFAELDLTEAKEWYDLQQENLGQQFIQEMNTVILRIAENPFQFSKERKYIRKAVLSQFPYSVFFYVNDDLINVFAIFHSSRNPIIWKTRFKNLS